ncbi:hypothetical protein A2160_01470 [Candidatus Beckwithbacteria bacterium RBG_13_42_9]|uniref:Diacylglycerol glucosyltransferase N-terminal domain-containing protein n=1 Tax=Candidatus Beckwithbacteria bacterium RBG_13_42_9 TaxID=1797457 RepID=A0A1F5E9F0_9BACT|nr:MAG: hypothetical protein A2160_01470 [Candidatus Beckwithbacteria bacterium RBG_13_42_9]
MALDQLKDSYNLVIFATAPAGLGHLRVSHALQDGFPENVASFVFGAFDPSLTYLHRLSSLNPFFRYLQYLVQYHPSIEQVFTDFYRSYLRNNPEETEKQLLTLLNTHQPPPATAVVVATHFGLAHEIASLKPIIESKLKVKIQLYVVVTDDTFHKIWAVDGAEAIIVPSLHTKNLLSNYFSQKKFKKPDILVNPYPLAPQLGIFPAKILLERKKQLSLKSHETTQVIIPISGAAVQLGNLENIIKGLSQISPKTFHSLIVSKQTSYTSPFLSRLSRLKNVSQTTATTDRETVDLYEKVFKQKEVPTLEITKPSEHAFKVLFTPKELGGVILLFTEPVGRQEEDNLQFLYRHHLLPTSQENSVLERQLLSNQPSLSKEILEKAHHWRGLILPQDPQRAITYIRNARDLGLFSQMLKFVRSHDSESAHDGVARFWQLVNERLPSHD